MYVDALKTISMLSLCLQEEKVDTVQGINYNYILKTVEILGSLTKMKPEEWPTAKRVIESLSDSNGIKEYQGSTLSNYRDSVISECSSAALSDLSKLDSNIKTRLAWSDLKLLRSFIVFLDTCSWIIPTSATVTEEPVEDKEEIRDAVHHLCSIFRQPLEAKGGTLFTIDDEVDEIVDYCRSYVNYTVDNYRRVWYTLGSTPDSTKWHNLMLLSELLFSLPFTNAKVERAFSTLKNIKTEHRTSMHTTTLDDLMEIACEGPEFEKFSAEDAVHLWWEDQNRRPNQKPRKQYKPRKSTATSEPSTSQQSHANQESDSESDSPSIILEDWDEWLSDDS